MPELDKKQSREEDIFMDGEDDEDTQANKYLIFKIQEECYGVEIRFINEIIELQKITTVPEMPAFVKGVINLRGKVIPLIDLRSRFKIPERPYDDRTCVIIINFRDSEVGFIVDYVEEIVDIPAQEIVPPPQFKGEGNSGKDYIKGLGKTGEVINIILDVEKILQQDEIAVLKIDLK